MSPFSNFSPGKTHPIQLSFDTGIKTALRFSCVPGSHLINIVYIVCTVISCGRCM